MATVENQLPIQPTGLTDDVIMACRNITGPTSYTTGGVTLGATAFGLQGFRVLMSSHLTASGTYFVRFQMPSGPGASTVTVLWYVASSGAQVTNATNLSAEKIRILAFGY